MPPPAWATAPQPNRLPPPPWLSPSPAPAAALPPPPWAQTSSASLRPLPVVAPVRTPGRKVALGALAVLVALVAAAAGYFGVRYIAHLENGSSIAAGLVASPVSDAGTDQGVPTNP